MRRTIEYGLFEWEADKADRKRVKHQDVSFEEATTVFGDPYFFAYKDVKHSKEEYVIIGCSERNRLLTVAFAERKRTRIIGETDLYQEESGEAL
jgi:uncharacterized DUF497 family protein